MLIEMQKQRRDWGVSILHCEGSLVPGPETGYLAAKLGEIEGLQLHNLLIDFEHVAAIGSAGVTFIVGIYLSVTRQPVTRQRGGRIVLTGVNGCVRHVLDLTRLTTLIPLASDLASGLAMLRAAAPPTYKGCLNLAIGERSLQQLLVRESFVLDFECFRVGQEIIRIIIPRLRSDLALRGGAIRRQFGATRGGDCAKKMPGA